MSSASALPRTPALARRVAAVLLTSLVLARTAALGAVITEPARVYSVGYDLGDVENPPVPFLASVTDSAIVSLTGVQVGLNLVGRGLGGFASEMVVALNKDLSVTSVLINRVGVTSGNPVGFGYDGWDVTFADGGAGGDIHVIEGISVLNGVYEPDGRLNPTDAARPALLDVFLGLAGNGDWRLSVGDLDLGGTMRLESWSLVLTGETDPLQVPEASTWAAVTALVLATFAQGWRRRVSARRPGRPR